MKKMTIKELAEISGFSTSTISRVLANSATVKEETRQEVERLLVANNYRSGTPGTRVARTIQKIILIVVNDPSNEFYLKTIRKIQAVCAAAGYLPVVGISNDSQELEAQYVMMAQDASLAGIVLMTPSETKTLKKLIAGSATPVVLVNRYLRFMDLDVVCIDNYRGGYLAAEYLVGRGITRICHLAGPQDSSASRDRRRGFQDALRDLGLEASDEDVYQGTLLRSSGREFARRLLEKPLRYDGVFFCQRYDGGGIHRCGAEKRCAYSGGCFSCLFRRLAGRYRRTVSGDEREQRQRDAGRAGRGHSLAAHRRFGRAAGQAGVSADSARAGKRGVQTGRTVVGGGCECCRGRVRRGGL